jgi:hypothetical protein
MEADRTLRKFLAVAMGSVAALLGFAGAAHAQGPDFDGDGVQDEFDNCSVAVNPDQDDTDGDDCGNLCDADYDNNGMVAWLDYAEFVLAFGSGDQEKCHVEPITSCTVGFPDFFYFQWIFGGSPGPSGTTGGTTACPLWPW